MSERPFWAFGHFTRARTVPIRFKYSTNGKRIGSGLKKKRALRKNPERKSSATQVPIEAKIEVKSAGAMGLGVFAKAGIRRGQLIEFAPCLFINAVDYRLIKKTDLIRFVYDADHGTVVIGLGFASLYNHSEEANATYVLYPKRRSIRFKALTDIKRGSEITINYGYHPSEPETWDDDYTQYVAKLRARKRAA